MKLYLLTWLSLSLVIVLLQASEMPNDNEIRNPLLQSENIKQTDVEVSNDHLTEQNDEQSTCVICAEEYDLQFFEFLQCTHKVCRECRRKITRCPLCRLEIGSYVPVVSQHIEIEINANMLNPHQIQNPENILNPNHAQIQQVPNNNAGHMGDCNSLTYLCINGFVSVAWLLSTNWETFLIAYGAQMLIGIAFGFKLWNAIAVGIAYVLIPADVHALQIGKQVWIRIIYFLSWIFSWAFVRKYQQ